MYNFCLAIQYVGIVILTIELIYLFFQKKTQIQFYLSGLVICLLINFVGYLFEMQAKDQSMALQAVKIIYMGKPFIVLSMFALTMHYCKIRVPKIVTYILVAVSISITVLVFFCEKHKIYYSSIEFKDEGLFPHLVLGHGVMYMVFMADIAFIAIAIFIITIQSMRRTVNKNEKSQILIFFIMNLSTVATLLIYLSGITKGYDITLVGYLNASILLSISLFRVKLLDTISLAREQAIDLLKEGVVVFDNVNNILFMNDSALDICRNLNTKESQFLRNLSVTLEETLNKGEVVSSGDRVFSIVKHDIVKNDVKYGFMYVFNDVTDSYYYVNRLEKEVRDKEKHVNAIQRKVTLGMADMVESRDSNTGGHVKRTSEVVKIFADSLKETKDEKRKYSERFLNHVINAAPMHDLGKIAVQDSILRKPGAFTPEEYEEMKMHSSKGAEIVKQVLSGIEDAEFVRVATNIAHYHHEKYDGTGYPKGLKGEMIPLEARIMALADVFDALVSKRCYKEKMSYDKAFTIIEESLDTHFDRELGLKFLECREKLIDYYELQGDEENVIR